MNPSAAPFAFENSFLRMPDHFYARVAPTPVEAPKLLALNRPLCEELGVSYQSLAPVADALLSGNQIPEGAASIALAYAGHQFGNFVPQLGDGRAILLGEILTPRGERKDIQLKGAGPTPFSRRGDGRAALGPVLREFLVSEAMHALGIPTTRALAAVATGEPVYREETLPGAVLTRVAASHIRVGTFEYFAVREDYRAVEMLARHVIARHYPELEALENPFLPLLDAVAQKQAALIARWMLVGFVHGVMNTDNMSVSGETIDYGPCAFLDRYDPATVFSSIDRGGRYAFANQPVIAQWNLARLAETLVPLIHPDTETALEMATAAIHKIPEYFESHWLAGMRLKLGLYSGEPGDKELAQRLLFAMDDGGADFTLTFRRLSQLCDATPETDKGDGPAALFSKPALFQDWAQDWQSRLHREPPLPGERAVRMQSVNPALIPRNHRVEEALAAAVRHGDLRPFETLKRALEKPYLDLPEFAHLAEPPQPGASPYRTFCGT